MSATDRHPPMCDAFARCTMRSACARMRRARSGGVAVELATIPLDGVPEPVREGRRRAPWDRRFELGDVGLEVHHLIRREGPGPEAERQRWIDEIADALDDGPHA